MPRAKATPHEANVDATATSTPSSALTSIASASNGAGQVQHKASRLPAPMRFPLVAILSFALSSLGYSVLGQWTTGELSGVARKLDTWEELSLLAAWRMCETALGWFGNLDSYDVAALSLLSRSPTLYLLNTFYGISSTTALACLAIDVIASFLPFILLRPLSRAHSANAAVPNGEIVTDRGIFVSTTILAAVIYSVALSAGFQTILPEIFVVYFNGIPTIEPTRSAAVLFVNASTVVLSLMLGVAARTFIFTPSATTGNTPEDAANAQFDPVSASLREHVSWNFWGYKTQTKVVIIRTAVVAIATVVETYLACTMTIRGVDSYGAVVYGLIWAVAACFTGLAFGVVGQE